MLRFALSLRTRSPASALRETMLALLSLPVAWATVAGLDRVEPFGPSALPRVIGLLLGHNAASLVAAALLWGGFRIAPLLSVAACAMWGLLFLDRWASSPLITFSAFAWGTLTTLRMAENLLLRSPRVPRREDPLTDRKSVV